MKILKKYNLKKFPFIKNKQALNYIHKVNDNTVEVTDGNILARIPAKEVNDDYYLLYTYPNSSKFNEYCPENNYFTKFQQNYPETNDIIPNTEDIIFTVNINAKHLYHLSQILGDVKISLGILKENKVVYVKPYDENNKAFGIIMLLKTNEQNTLEESKENTDFVNWLKTQPIYNKLVKRYKKIFNLFSKKINQILILFSLKK